MSPVTDEPLSPRETTATTTVAQDQVVPLTPELLISQLLRGGVLLSLSLVACGMVMTFFRHPDYFSSPDALQRLTSPDDAPHQLTDVFEGVMAVRGQSFVMAGLLVMITVPVLRVALSLGIFRAQKDRAFAAITTGVLALLLLAFLLGGVE
ncbi:DUF1634 domain-containing protein [Corallococcus exiguus]|uniref:DUF1634 domain-containing protein n=1 Tax=Corallococcus TaxID=83461 RepID=UPI000EBB1BBE|nr:MULTISPECIES: DUF1634 domain-containing protein [Corallococcus]NNB85745.1 DUF1634 domain-containing protein [Corallococcus exiguus]NNB95751.1 DUF1634 domain-containing protein [Corallococcus exiguus]NNC06120.1 DUF1634 domain-containing protein [Corallococcus exiguus]NPC46474.1 DUF1634 domain-containing protein [Corallococcus exiguus]RKH79430.1 DUF1634 domain-containing protein [Corallococcus sp. AB032C]